MSKRSMGRSRTKKDEQEVLNAPVNMDGHGEDPAVKAMLSDEFVQGTNSDAVEIGLALQQIIRGQNSILANEQAFAEDLAALRRRMDEMDKAAARWNDDRENFVQEVLDRAEKLKATGLEKDKLIAKGANDFSEAISKARAEQAVEHLQFEEKLKTMPKVSVISPGELVMVSEGGRQVAKLMNETVKIKTHKWVLPIGKVVDVPQIVAEVLNDRRRLQEETAARERLLSAHPESSILDKKWKEINTTFNSTTDTLPTA